MATPSPFEISAHERGVVRVFALDNALATEIGRGESLAPLARALGIDELGAEDVQIVEMRVMEEVGLSGLLTEGYDIEPTELADAAETLDTLTGEVAVVRSAAFGGEETRLRLTGAATLMGTYRERSARPPRFGPLDSDAAQGQLSSPQVARDRPTERPLAFWIALALAAVCLILLLWSLL